MTQLPPGVIHLGSNTFISFVILGELFVSGWRVFFAKNRCALSHITAREIIAMRKSFSTFLYSGICIFFLLVSSLQAFSHGTVGFDSREPVCLKSYPVNPELFNETLYPYVEKIINQHGLEEWKATLLTNEMHRHLGLWSLIGAKMGIRARQVLDAPFDHLQVVSFAGFNPPFSCLNDGIQISTGASLGRGTISNTLVGQPQVIFISNEKKLMMKPKTQIIKTVKETITRLSKDYGFQSALYFKELEKISVNYWLEWKREEMFEETFLH